MRIKTSAKPRKTNPKRSGIAKSRWGRRVVRKWCGAGVVGAWKSRDDIHESSTFARSLRERAQRR